MGFLWRLGRKRVPMKKLFKRLFGRFDYLEVSALELSPDERELAELVSRNLGNLMEALTFGDRDIVRLMTPEGRMLNLAFSPRESLGLGMVATVFEKGGGGPERCIKHTRNGSSPDFYGFYCAVHGKFFES